MSNAAKGSDWPAKGLYCWILCSSIFNDSSLSGSDSEFWSSSSRFLSFDSLSFRSATCFSRASYCLAKVPIHFLCESGIFCFSSLSRSVSSLPISSHFCSARRANCSLWIFNLGSSSRACR